MNLLMFQYEVSIENVFARFSPPNVMCSIGPIVQISWENAGPITVTRKVSAMMCFSFFIFKGNFLFIGNSSRQWIKSDIRYPEIDHDYSINTMPQAFFAPHLTLKNVKAAMDYYQKAFDAKILRQWDNADG